MPRSTRPRKAKRTRLPVLISTACRLAAALCLGSALQGLAAPAAMAQAAATQRVDLQAAPLAQTLNNLATLYGRVLAADPAQTGGLMAPAVVGRYSLPDALRQALVGSGLEPVILPGGAITVRRVASGAVPTLDAVTVSASETAWGPVSGYVARRSATGTKTDTPLIETPQSISVISAERAAAIGANNIKDALGYTPGVSITTYGADSRYDWVSIRGFDAYSPGFYLDGLPLRNNGNWGIWQTENYGAERIELLRGPASVLYGLAMPGGLVNVVSKRPTAEPLHELQAQVGDHQRRQLAGDFSGPLDDSGQWLYRLTAVGLDSNLPARGIDGHLDNRRVYLAPSLTWRPSADTSLTLLAQYAQKRGSTFTRARPAVGSLAPTPIGTHIPSELFTGQPGFDHFNQTQRMIGYLFEHRVSDALTLRQNLRYGHLNVDYAAVQASGFLTRNVDDPLDPSNYDTLSRSSFGSKERITSFAMDNQAQLTLGAGDWKHVVLAGIDYQRTRMDQYSYSGGNAPPLHIYDPVYGGRVEAGTPFTDAVIRIEQLGFYLQDQIKWNDRWALTLGGRYDRAKSVTDSRLDGSVTREPSHKFSTRAGLVYLHPSGVAPYVSYANSFAPTATLDPVSGKPFGPETGRQYEAGVRYQPPGGRSSYSAAVFDLRRQNYISYDANGVPRQAGEVVVRGLEFEATVQPVAGMNLIAAYSWTPKADVTKSADASQIGKQATAVPRHRASLWADYRWASGLKIGAGLRYVGANRGDYEAAPVKVPSSTLVDAMIGYDIDRWSFAVNARNLANRTYFANCGPASCYYGDGRSVIGTATYRW